MPRGTVGASSSRDRDHDRGHDRRGGHDHGRGHDRRGVHDHGRGHDGASRSAARVEQLVPRRVWPMDSYPFPSFLPALSAGPNSGNEPQCCTHVAFRIQATPLI